MLISVDCIGKDDFEEFIRSLYNKGKPNIIEVIKECINHEIKDNGSLIILNSVPEPYQE